jgi:acetolactate synthase-1/2/3 large subunit
MVHIAGAVPLNSPLEPFHGVDDPAFVDEMFRPITKCSTRVERLADVPEVMAKAFHIARSGRPGPVHVELPRVADYSEFVLQEKPEALPAYKPVPATVVQPAPQDVDRFARRLMEAKAPVIAAGKGVIRTGAMDKLAALAERLQAPVIFAQDSIGVIPEDHPLSAGFISEIQPHPLCAAVLKDADVVFCVGMRPGAAEMVALTMSVPEDRLMVAGYDDRKTEHYRGDFQRAADPGLFLEALAARLGNFHAAPNAAMVKMLAEAKTDIRRTLAAQNAPHRNDTPIFPGILMDAMNAVLADDAIVASDVGSCQMWLRRHRRIVTPESFMQSGVWNAMSYGFPTAMVAKLEFPERDVIGIAGDGAFLMTSGDLPTAAEYDANILMIVLNNGTFGQTFMQQQGLYGHTYGTSFTSPDFAMMAKACGCEGMRVSDPGALEDALRQGLAATWHKPVLLEVMTGDYPYPRI